jgi:hypothetical protein
VAGSPPPHCKNCRQDLPGCRTDWSHSGRPIPDLADGASRTGRTAASIPGDGRSNQGQEATRPYISDDVAMAACAIRPYTVPRTDIQGCRVLIARPGRQETCLAPRDHSLVTASALIASGQVAQSPYHLNRNVQRTHPAASFKGLHTCPFTPAGPTFFPRYRGPGVSLRSARPGCCQLPQCYRSTEQNHAGRPRGSGRAVLYTNVKSAYDLILQFTQMVVCFFRAFENMRRHAATR